MEVQVLLGLRVESIGPEQTQESTATTKEDHSWGLPGNGVGMDQWTHTQTHSFTCRPG